jgi:hypothetical protein
MCVVDESTAWELVEFARGQDYRPEELARIIEDLA